MGSAWHPGQWCFLLVAGVSGLATLYMCLNSLSHKLLLWRVRRLVRTCKRKIFVITSEEKWNNVIPLLLRDVDGGGVAALGMDCEWTEESGRRQPVALLQLASPSGTCALVHLAAFTTPLPASLKNLLGNVNIIKAGVGITQDKKFLEVDFGVRVEGCVELRHLVLRCREGATDRQGATAGLGLAALSHSYLHRTLDKDWRVRASNWQANILTDRQISYAADDALVGVQLLLVLCAKLWVPNWLLPLLPAPFFQWRLVALTHTICRQFFDLKFSINNERTICKYNSSRNQKAALNKISKPTNAYSIRQSPLYHNCQLLAPDDTPLCTCDPKKAQWYIEKGLGVEVKHNPLVVRLNFEPAGRPRAECQDESFYVQERHNLCVVCGQEHSYLKKNVMPQEYRKCLPGILKDRQSHDIVPLCIKCHRLSNVLDTALKEALARECNAPLKQEGGRNTKANDSRKKVKNAAGALLRNRATIPETRVTELEDIIKAYYTVDAITQDVLEEAFSLDIREGIENQHRHAQRVCEAYMKKGLVKLQQRWRQHFLDTMQPKYLPQHWSVTHNLQKMWEVMTSLSQDHPDYEVYRVALVGTDNTTTELTK